MEKFDCAIIGAGPGGYVCAIRAAQLGLKTAIIEKEENLGGVCLNMGCIPSKALLESSEWYFQAKNKFKSFGILLEGIQLDLNAMMQRKKEIVKTLGQGIQLLLKKNKVATFTGIARLKTQDTIIVEKGFESQEIQAQAIVLATGSMPIELPFMKFDGNFIVSSTEALSFEKVPQHLIVVGGGAIGLELGSVWSRLGAKVSVVEMLPQIVPFADKQIATLLQRYLKSQGIEFYTNTKVTKAENNSTEVTIQDAEGKENKLTGDKVLVCVGRRPNSKFVGIDTVGIQTESSGRIIIQENFETNVKGIYAIGDLVAGPMLAHKAEEEGICVAEILAHKTPHINYNAIPNVVYTNPELAMVGITEEQAKEKKLEIRVGKSYFKGNGRALTMSESDGMVKIIADAKTDRVLGIHILGPRASDMIAQAALAFEFKASSEDIGRTIYAHPTLPEAIKEAALAITNQAIHG